MSSLRAALKRLGAKADRAYRGNPLRRSLVRLQRRAAASVVSPDFWYGRYPHTFLERRPPARQHASALPRVIWCFWVGDNPLTPAREAGFASIVDSNPDFTVELVTPERLDDLLVDGHPLHPSYQQLSYNHRSDYLRAYFLHHYGGAYADVKPIVGPWSRPFERFEASDAWVMGPPLTRPDWAGNPSGRLEEHLRRYYRSIPSGGMLMARSYTALTAEWLRELERRLDYYAPALWEHPGGIWGQDPAYPIDWMELQGNIFQPLCLKYRSWVLLDSDMMWDTSRAYR